MKARSLYFEKLFLSDMVETGKMSATLEDLQADTFEEALHYIYTGEVKESAGILALELYQAADLFQIDDLKAECLSLIDKNISKQNVLAVYDLIELHNIEGNLKEKALQIIAK
jgi:hypothetical protein